jgi:2-iminobutanoate/2-iminopropanoate deaminase
MTRQEIQTNGAPAALGPYSQAIRSGDLVFCSGQVGLDPATAELVDGVEAQAERALRNLQAVLDAAGLGLDDVVKTTIFLVDVGDFAAVNAVYAKFMPEPPPARSTVGIAALPKGALVEIEAIAHRPLADAVARHA